MSGAIVFWHSAVRSASSCHRSVSSMGTSQAGEEAGVHQQGANMSQDLRPQFKAGLQNLCKKPLHYSARLIAFDVNDMGPS